MFPKNFRKNFSKKCPKDSRKNLEKNFRVGDDRLKRADDVFEHAPRIFASLPDPGILLSTQADGRPNVMNIGWASLGFEWQTPIFIIYVRHCRFTHEILEKNPEFTICAPLDSRDPEIKKILAVCGSKSGRDIDKFEANGLTKVPADLVKPPAIREFPVTVECKVVCKIEQPIALIDEEFHQFYPKHINSPTAPATNSPHTIYYGKILKSYVIE